MTSIYILGGAQTDFARNWAREGLGIYDMFEEALHGAVRDASIEPCQIQVGHVGNFVGDLFCGQGQLNGFFAEVYPELTGIPTARHEAACASGTMAILAAMRDIEAGHYQVAAVVGVELMRNVDGRTGAEHLGAAAWAGREALDCTYPWPHMFDQVIREYDARYGIHGDALLRIAEINFSNARTNPRAQSRSWQFPEGSFSCNDELNPVIEGRVRRQDCGQITDGAACVILAGESAAREHAERTGTSLANIPRIKGWGHRSAPLSLASKLQRSAGAPLIFPHVRDMFNDALRRAGIGAVTELDGLETHDCFSITEYMVIDHSGLTAPGESWKAVMDGRITRDGDFPINPSGGLIGLGHPVGATGVRMALDCARQVTGRADGYQLANARTLATFNLGGSATTCSSLIIGCDQ
ncbi:acetyl-CoA acetyltransferase [Parahaliea mediterranea]|uniref:acetyl-CoA acetyltransferase n=1 Tax=Parahaliea mediterranea TaxID=651086 RepID=UPI000E2F3760|nr:acetyl-CoA acetyltransferase [Parahaliea mediterranea]